MPETRCFYENQEIKPISQDECKTFVLQWKPMRNTQEFQWPSHCTCYQGEFKISAEARKNLTARANVEKWGHVASFCDRRVCVI